MMTALVVCCGVMNSASTYPVIGRVAEVRQVYSVIESGDYGQEFVLIKYVWLGPTVTTVLYKSQSLLC